MFLLENNEIKWRAKCDSGVSPEKKIQICFFWSFRRDLNDVSNCAQTC